MRSVVLVVSGVLEKFPLANTHLCLFYFISIIIVIIIITIIIIIIIITITIKIFLHPQIKNSICVLFVEKRCEIKLEQVIFISSSLFGGLH